MAGCAKCTTGVLYYLHTGLPDLPHDGCCIRHGLRLSCVVAGHGTQPIMPPGNYLPAEAVTTLASSLRRLPQLKVLSLEACGLDAPQVRGGVCARHLLALCRRGTLMTAAQTAPRLSLDPGMVAIDARHHHKHACTVVP